MLIRKLFYFLNSIVWSSCSVYKMISLQVYHKKIDSLYKNALLLEDANELINFLAENNFEGVNYVDSKIAKDLSNLTPADEVKICSLLDFLMKVNETAGIFDLSDYNVLLEVTFPILEQLFNIIADENYNLVVFAKVLQLFSKFFLNPATLRLIHESQSFEGPIQILGRKLPLIGDYICQLHLCECLFILSSTSEMWPDAWFSDAKIKSIFLNIDGSNFEEDARKTLNTVNRMEDNQRVFSYPVKSIMFGTIELQKPGEDFWVDFNYGTESISFFFLYDNDSFWETARVMHFNVNRYMFKDNKKRKLTELIITLDCPCYQIVDDISENPVTESNILTIVFHSVQKIKDHVEKVFGSRCCVSSQNEDGSSACSNVVSMYKYKESDCSEFDRKKNDIGCGKASVCENMINLGTNEAEECLSISKERKASSMTIHLQSNENISTCIEGEENSNNADDECIPRSVGKNDFKPTFKKSSTSCVNIVAVEESYVSVDQANTDELEKCMNASLDKQKHIVSNPPSPTTQKLASEHKQNSLQEGLSVSSPSVEINDDPCSAMERKSSVNLELDKSTLKLMNVSSDISNLAHTSEEKSFHFENIDKLGKNTHVGVENTKNLKVCLESDKHPRVSQKDGDSSNKKRSHHPSLSNDPFSCSEMTDTAIGNKKKKKKKICDVSDDVRRKSVEEIFDIHSDSNINQNTRRSALWARKKSKAMLDLENFADDEQNFDIQCQPKSSRPNFTISSGKGPTPSKKHRSIFHTDTETISSGHSWLKKKKKLFEPPKRKYSDRKKAKKTSKIPEETADVNENTVYDLNNCAKAELDQKKKNIKHKSNELTNKSSYKNWSDIENNELFVEKVPSHSCLSKKKSRAILSEDSNVSIEHPVEPAVLEYEESNKRLKYDSTADFEQNIEDNETFNIETELQDSFSKNISRDMASKVHRVVKNTSDPSRMKSKDSLLSHKREENKLVQTSTKERPAAVVSQLEEIRQNNVNLPLKVLSEHQFDSGIEVSKIHTKSSLEEYDVACDESKGKKIHLKYFLSSLTETSDLAEKESGTDYTNNSKKRKSESFNAVKKRKKLKIDGKQKESKTLNQEVLQVGSDSENSSRVLTNNRGISTKPNLKVEKNKIGQDFEVPVDDIITCYSDENISRKKECHIPSSYHTEAKEQEKPLKSAMKLDSKKTEINSEEFERNAHPHTGNFNIKMFKRPSFSSGCSDRKKSKQIETLLSRLAEWARHLSRKLIATFQICSQDYYFQLAKMRRHMLHVSECLSKTDAYLPTKDLKKMIKKCQLFRKKVEQSLRKLVYIGQEYFEFEKKCQLRMKNKNRRAGSKFCHYLQSTYTSASILLEKKVLLKLNKLHKNFMQEINGL